MEYSLLVVLLALGAGSAMVNIAAAIANVFVRIGGWLNLKL